MTNDELNEKIRQACTHAAPDVLDAVLSDCNEQKGRVILMTTENKKKTWAVRMGGSRHPLRLPGFRPSGAQLHLGHHRYLKGGAYAEGRI